MTEGLAADLTMTEVAEPSGLGCLVIVARSHGLHLTPEQLIHDNVLPSGETSTDDLLRCAEQAGLVAKAIKLDWAGLKQLRNALPAIVSLKNGSRMVLLRLEGEEANLRLVLQDPNASDDALLFIDRIRFDVAFTSEIILVKRNYDLKEEDRPFSIGLIAALVFRERRMVRDVIICAVLLGVLALTPIMFWRILSGKVLYYKAFNTFAVVCLAMVLLTLFEAAFFYLRQSMVQFLTARLDVKLNTYMFERVLNLPIDFFEKTSVGLIARDMREIFKIRGFLVGQMFGTVLDSALLVFFLPVMLFFSPLMTAIVLMITALIVLWLIVMLPHHRKRSSAVMAAEGEQGAFLVQTLNGIRTVKSLALDARQRKQWDVLVARTAKARIAEGLSGNLISSVVRPLERLAISVPYAVGVFVAMTSNDPMQISALFAFLMLSQRVAQPLMQMAQLINQYEEARLAVAAVGNLVNQPVEEGRSGHGVRAALKGDIQFSNVVFRYKGTLTPALNEVSFEAPEGTMLGIVGKSGSGKTTIARLLQRLNSDYEGLIKIGGIDVREYDVDHLRRSIGVVLQENFLFSGTIRDNIAAAKPDATFEDVVRAARLAGAEEFIDKLPRGYDTYIHEGSPNLSGGQRQRLAIARALIVDPPILILDEATSALDAESEAIVNENIHRIAHGRTLIVISHRLSSLMKSDAILVLNQGRVDDIGKHSELLQRNAIYSGLWSQQNSHMAVPRALSPSVRNPTLV